MVQRDLTLDAIRVFTFPLNLDLDYKSITLSLCTFILLLSVLGFLLISLMFSTIFFLRSAWLSLLQCLVTTLFIGFYSTTLIWIMRWSWPLDGWRILINPFRNWPPWSRRILNPLIFRNKSSLNRNLIQFVSYQNKKTHNRLKKTVSLWFASSALSHHLFQLSWIFLDQYLLLKIRQNPNKRFLIGLYSVVPTPHTGWKDLIWSCVLTSYLNKFQWLSWFVYSAVVLICFSWWHI